MIHSFLMIGQSNMAGRGFPSEVEPISSSRLWVLRNGRWQPMYVPVNGDRTFSGICLAESFALRYSQLHDVDVGLIPCADGGTSMDQWAPGDVLFDHAVMQARLAMRSSMLCGILWHQGESDCAPDRAAVYEDKLCSMLEQMRETLGQKNLPVVAGLLGDYLADSPWPDENLKNYHQINEALEQAMHRIPNAAIARAEELTCNPDGLHFDARSLREFGLRYEAAFETLKFAPVGADTQEKIHREKMEQI